jgi:hypothetical protein
VQAFVLGLVSSENGTLLAVLDLISQFYKQRNILYRYGVISMHVHHFLITSRLADWLKLGMKIMPLEATPLSCCNSFPSVSSTAILQTSEILNTSCRN